MTMVDTRLKSSGRAKAMRQDENPHCGLRLLKSRMKMKSVAEFACFPLVLLSLAL